MQLVLPVLLRFWPLITTCVHFLIVPGTVSWAGMFSHSLTHCHDNCRPSTPLMSWFVWTWLMSSSMRRKLFW